MATEVSHVETMEKMAATMKTLERKVNRLQRQQNAADKANGVVPPTRNNGFNKAEAMSPELCAFLGLAAGSELPRPEVTKRISEYVKTNGLQNGKKINMNDTLRNLLKVEPDAEVTYFTLQRYLKNHFISKKAAETTTDTEPPAPVPAAPVPTAPTKKRRSTKA